MATWKCLSCKTRFGSEDGPGSCPICHAAFIREAESFEQAVPAPESLRRDGRWSVADIQGDTLAPESLDYLRSLRDDFAGLAMLGIVTRYGMGMGAGTPKDAYDLAEQMMAERARRDDALRNLRQA